VDALLQARQAYGSNTQSIRTHRGAEYEAFARVTHRLKTAAATDVAALASAIHDNRRLWTLLASDVIGDNNGLPEILRARIVYLAEFTRQHSSKVLMRKASASALVEINTAIMGGLRDRSTKT